MPNDEGFMTRDEYIQTYGVDPLAETQKEQEQPSTLARYGKGLAVGAATAYPSWIGIPETIGAGVKAAYSSLTGEEKFMDEFVKNMQVDDAQQRIQEHLEKKAGEFANAGGDVENQLVQYKESKEFEDFMHSLFKGGIGVSQKVQDVARSAVGDTRTDAQRDWTDSAAEVIGGALVGGPAGIPAKIAASAAKRGVTNVLLNNIASRAAIKGLELTSPVTIPYTAPNVAANAIVGTALDQGLRYAQGRDTAFTPATPESPGVGTAITGAAAVGGLAAFVAAMRGNQKAALHVNIQNTAAKTGKVAKAAEEGLEPPAREQQLDPSSSIDEAGVVAAGRVRSRSLMMDEGSPLLRQLGYNRPKMEDWRDSEALYRSTTGPVLEDKVNQSTEMALHDLNLAFRTLDAEKQKVVLDGMGASTIKSRYDHTESTLLSKIEEAKKGSEARRKAMDDLKRLQNDKDETARIILPDTPRSQINRVAALYEKNTDPDITRFRDAHEVWADRMIQNEVDSGRMTKEFASDLRKRDRYYTPLEQDPFGGTTGLERIKRQVLAGIKSVQTVEAGTGRTPLSRESPIRAFKPEVPDVNMNKSVETRITTLRNPLETISNYTRNSFRSTAHEVQRRELLKRLATTDEKFKVKSDFVNDGSMTIVPNPRTGKHWTPAEKVYNNEDLLKLIDDNMHVPEWENGRVRVWKFGDKEIALALRHDPVKFSGLVRFGHIAANWFKFFTTGAGNPIFSVKGAMYNIMINMLTRRLDRAYGTVSFLAHRFLPKPVAMIVGAIDPTVLVTAPYHTLASVTQFMAWSGARYIADKLRTIPQFNAFRQMVGEQRFQAAVKKAVEVAAWTENLSTLKMMRGGATHGIRAIDNLQNAHSAYSGISQSAIPRTARGLYSFYKGLLDAVYLGGSRPYYVQNHALLAHQYGGASKIPPAKLLTLMHETRTVGGDMSLVPASKLMRDLEATFPYMSQAKLGAYHLARNMFGKDTFYYVLPRMAMLMSAVGMSFYWRTYWNEESRREFWQRRPEYDRYRLWDVPAPELWMAWARGENPAYSRDLYYSLTLPPDLVGIIAGSAALLQEMGVLPQDATPRPIKRDLPNLIMDSLMPAMPPMLQLAAGSMGYKLDPQGAETRGGNWIRQLGSQFRSGPAAESASNLGQISNSTALMMNAAFGAMGSYLAASTDVLLHAAKFKPSAEVGGTLTLRDQQDFAAGLRAATGTLVERATQNAPDVALIWQKPEKYRASTPDWQFVKQNDQHIRSIVSTGRDAYGKAGQRRRALAAEAGGIPEQAAADETLLGVAKMLDRYQNPTGVLGRLRKQYADLSGQNRALSANYRLSQEQRRNATNAVVKQMQDNMQQQHLAIKFFEQEIADNYAQQLAPRLRGRTVSVETLDRMMRESFGSPAPEQAQAQPAD